MVEDTVAMVESKRVGKLLKASQKFASAPETACIKDEKADISLLPAIRVSGLSYGGGRTPVPVGLGQYLEKYGVQYCVLLFALSLYPGRMGLPTLLDPGRQLPMVMQTLLLALPGMDAGRQASGQMATWMGSLWAGLGRAEPGATIRVGKRQKEPLLTFYLS